MMVAYLVTVQQGTYESRFVDSIWIDKANADKRVENLGEEFNRKGRKPKEPDFWYAFVSTVTIQDADLGNPKPKEKGK